MRISSILSYELGLFRCLYEFIVIPGARKEIQYILYRFICLQAVQTLAHRIDGLQLIRSKKQILTPCAGLWNINGREYTLLLKLPVQHQLHSFAVTYVR